MKCTLSDLRAKEVVNADNGCRLGCVTDIDLVIFAKALEVPISDILSIEDL